MPLIQSIWFIKKINYAWMAAHLFQCIYIENHFVLSSCVSFRFVLKYFICTMWKKKTTRVYREKHRRLIHANGSTILNRSIIYDWWFWSMELQTSRLSFVRFVWSPFYLKPFDLFRSKSWAMAIDDYWSSPHCHISHDFNLFSVNTMFFFRYVNGINVKNNHGMNEWRCCTAVPLWFPYLWHGILNLFN